MDNSYSFNEQETTFSGEEALAWGGYLAEIEFLAAVASFPGNELILNINNIGKFRKDDLAWYSNGKSAIEAAFGASLAGKKSAVNLRGSELCQALDTLATIPLSDWFGGLIIFCVDDPGAWFSHNEIDSRSLSAAVQIPVLEAQSIKSAFSLPTVAMQWSLQFKLPILIRYTTSFSQETQKHEEVEVQREKFKSKRQQWKKPIVLQPKDVLEKRVLWEHRLDKLTQEFNTFDQNKIEHEGQKGILCVGYLAQKIKDVVEFDENPFKMLTVETVYPFPFTVFETFAQGLEELLVLEEGEPLVERVLLAYFNQKRSNIHVSGKMSHTVSKTGEVFRWQLEDVLTQWHPEFESKAFFFPYQEQKEQFMPESYCQSGAYDAVIDLLDELYAEHSSDKKAVVVANPGCVLRALIRRKSEIQVSAAPGSAIGIAASISRQKPNNLVVALIGDNAFYHSGLNSLIDAVYHRSDMLVIILDNGVSAISGFQPNPGSGVNAKSRKTTVVSIEDLLLGMPLNHFLASSDDEEHLRNLFWQAVDATGVRVLHVKTKIVI